MADVERTLGQLEGRLDSAESDIAEIKKDVKEILAHINEAKGGWKLMMVLGGVSASIGGVIATYLPKFFVK